MSWQQFTQKVNQSFDQVKQFANEKLAQPDPVLPPDFQQLDLKLEKIQKFYTDFIRLVQFYSYPDYDPPVADNIKEAVGKINEFIKQPSITSPVSPTSSAPENRSLAYAMSKSAFSHSNLLGVHEPLGVALKKFGEVQEQIGKEKNKFEEDVYGSFTLPFHNTLKNNITTAVNAKRALISAKTNFDLAKTKLKHATNDKLQQVQQELEVSEMKFNECLQDALYKIRLVVDSAEPLRNLKDLVKAQKKYFQDCCTLLEGVDGELEELQVTQEALFNSK